MEQQTTTASYETGVHILQRMLAPIAGALMITAALAAVFMIQPIFVDIAYSLQLEPTDARITFSVISLAYALSFFVFGPVADRFDYVRMAFVGSIVLAVSIVLMSQVTGHVMFFVLMALAGAAAASIVSPIFPYMSRIAPEGKVGTYMGYCLSATITGIIFGRTLVGVLTAYIGWRMTFVGVAAIVLVLGLLFIVTGSSVTGQSENDKKSKQSSLIGAYRDSIKLLTNFTILRLMLVGSLLFVAYIGELTFLTYYLEGPLFDFSSEGIGWISLAGLAAVLIAPVAGTLAHKLGAVKVVMAGILMVFVSIQLMLWLPNVFAVIVGVLLLYLGVYVCQPAVFYFVTTLVEPKKFGSASALYLLVCLGGGSLASYILGPIWSRYNWFGISAVATAAIISAMLLMWLSAPSKTAKH